MKSVHKSVLIWYSPQDMFSLVTDVAKYPEFLPWCDHAQVLEGSPDSAEMRAEVGIGFGGLRQSFVTHNTHQVEGAAREVHLKLVKGPFSKLEGQWQFLPVGDGQSRACKVVLDLHYGFDSTTLGLLVGPVFDKIASTLVDAFVKRAEQVYGG
jgi:ribosome-associated toxin RatA of RatAB toxin-antitoxin module